MYQPCKTLSSVAHCAFPKTFFLGVSSLLRGVQVSALLTKLCSSPTQPPQTPKKHLRRRKAQCRLSVSLRPAYPTHSTWRPSRPWPRPSPRCRGWTWTGRPGAFRRISGITTQHLKCFKTSRRVAKYPQKHSSRAEEKVFVLFF